MERGLMALGRSEGTLRPLETLWSEGSVGALSDGELLARFIANTGDTAEAAFAALVERHGPMVFLVCREMLGEEHDAHDASQVDRGNRTIGNPVRRGKGRGHRGLGKRGFLDTGDIDDHGLDPDQARDGVRPGRRPRGTGHDRHRANRFDAGPRITTHDGTPKLQARSGNPEARPSAEDRADEHQSERPRDRSVRQTAVLRERERDLNRGGIPGLGYSVRHRCNPCCRMRLTRGTQTAFKW
jgi:hypothetical protein